MPQDGPIRLRLTDWLNDMDLLILSSYQYLNQEQFQRSGGQKPKGNGLRRKKDIIGESWNDFLLVYRNNGEIVLLLVNFNIFSFYFLELNQKAILGASLRKGKSMSLEGWQDMCLNQSYQLRQDPLLSKFTSAVLFPCL